MSSNLALGNKVEHQTLPDAGRTRLSRGESGGSFYLF